MDRMVALAQSTSASLKVTRAPASGRVRAHQPKPATADSRSTLASPFSIAQQNRSLLHRAATTLQPNVASRYHCNQQYSITAITSSSGAVQERYAYSAYGAPTIANASGTVLTTSAHNNRYTYTGREWDNDIKQYHYRARMYDASLGRFCSRDPVGYASGSENLFQLLESNSMGSVDPLGETGWQIYPSAGSGHVHYPMVIGPVPCGNISVKCKTGHYQVPVFPNSSIPNILMPSTGGCVTTPVGIFCSGSCDEIKTWKPHGRSIFDHEGCHYCAIVNYKIPTQADLFCCSDRGNSSLFPLVDYLCTWGYDPDGCVGNEVQSKILW
jgi:RHS repeat-associated protein